MSKRQSTKVGRACEVCGKHFLVYKNVLAKRTVRCCSRDCRRTLDKGSDKSCETCGKMFYVSRSTEIKNKPRFCSTECFVATRRGKTTHTQTIEEILEERVDKSTGCWAWTGSKSVVIQCVMGNVEAMASFGTTISFTTSTG